jgi:hypothetical protein
MLKPVEPTPPPERPIGELVHELIEEGKGYARAEIGLLKAIATAKGKALILPTALVLGVVLALATLVGPLAAGVLGMLLFAAIAGGLAWWGVQRAKDVL